MLNWYRQLLTLRRDLPALREGSYVPLESGNADVVAFARLDRSGQGVLVLLNMSAAQQRLAISGWAGGHVPSDGRVLLTTQPYASADLANPVLAPFATRLVAFRVR